MKSSGRETGATGPAFDLVDGVYKAGAPFFAHDSRSAKRKSSNGQRSLRERHQGILGRGYDATIIAGRVKHLVHEILDFKKPEECERLHGQGRN